MKRTLSLLMVLAMLMSFAGGMVYAQTDGINKYLHLKSPATDARALSLSFPNNQIPAAAENLQLKVKASGDVTVATGISIRTSNDGTGTANQINKSITYTTSWQTVNISLSDVDKNTYHSFAIRLMTNAYDYYYDDICFTDANGTVLVVAFDFENYETDSNFTAYAGEWTGIKKIEQETVQVGDNLSVDCEMLTGASIRLNNRNGIRFYTMVDKDRIAALKAEGATVEMGTLIAPADLINGKVLDFSLNDSEYANVPFTSNEYYTQPDFEGVVGSIVNIRPGNIARNFVGRGYVKVTKGDKTTISYANYSGNDIANNSRSLAYVAYIIKNKPDDYSALTDAQKSLVDEWAAAYTPPGLEANNIDFEDGDMSAVSLVGTDVRARIVERDSKVLQVSHDSNWDYLNVADNYAAVTFSVPGATTISFDTYYEGWSSQGAHYGIVLDGVVYWDQPHHGGLILTTPATISITAGKTLYKMSGTFNSAYDAAKTLTADDIGNITAIVIHPVNNHSGQNVFIDNINFE